VKQTIRNMDFWGTTTSLICAVHCALVPLILSFGYVKSTSLIINPLFEFFFLGLTFIFVYLSIIKPYMRNGQNPSSFYLAIMGFVLIILHHFLPAQTPLTIVSAGLFIASSHILNMYLLKKEA